jgi:tetratricopeptide (TPR) repeat protein
LEAVVLKALEKEPRDRYGSALELAEDLERFLRNEPVLARRPGPLKTAWRKTLKHPTVSGLVLLIFALAISAFVLWQSLRRRDVEAELAGAESVLAQAALSHDDQQRPLGSEQRRNLLVSAVARASAALSRDADYARAWFVRAKAHHRLQNYGEALLDLDRAASLDGLTASILHYRVDTLRQLGTLEAEKRLRADLLRLLDVDHSPYAWSIVLDHVVELARHSDPATRADALAIAERVLETAPDLTNPRVAVAQAMVFELRGDADSALTAIRAACDEHRSDAFVHAQAAKLLRRHGHYAEAATATATARAADPDIAIDEFESAPAAAARVAPEGPGDDLRKFFDNLTDLLDALGGEPRTPAKRGK